MQLVCGRGSFDAGLGGSVVVLEKLNNPIASMAFERLVLTSFGRVCPWM
jgi:hypothetical protein